MTGLVNVLEQLIEDLRSSNLDNKIEAIQYIEEEARYKFLVPVLLDMLSIENDISVLNALALCLGKLGVNDAVPILMGYIRNPDFKNVRGSFIYALLDLDCDEYFLDFVKMICDGDFEVYDHSFLVFESIVDEASYAQKLEAVEILENQKAFEISKFNGKPSQFDRINYIVDALKILRESI